MKFTKFLIFSWIILHLALCSKNDSKNDSGANNNPDEDDDENDSGNFKNYLSFFSLTFQTLIII